MEPNESLSATIEQRKKILKSRAEILKIPLEEESISNKIMDGLEFQLANERYIIDAGFVKEVVSNSIITPLPSSPNFILGIINIRGKILAVIDINIFLNLTKVEITNFSKLIVLTYQGIELAILVNQVIGTKVVYQHQLQSKISTITDDNSNYCMGVTNGRETLLDIKKFLQDERLIIDEKV